MTESFDARVPLLVCRRIGDCAARWITSAWPRDVHPPLALRPPKPLRWSARQNSPTPRHSTHDATLSHMRYQKHPRVASRDTIDKEEQALFDPRCLGYRAATLNYGSPQYCVDLAL